MLVGYFSKDTAATLKDRKHLSIQTETISLMQNGFSALVEIFLVLGKIHGVSLGDHVKPLSTLTCASL